MREKLLPCPWCGPRGDVQVTQYGRDYFSIKCRECGCEGPHRTMGHSLVNGEELAIDEWNTRVAMQSDAAPVAHCGDADVPLCSACSVPIVELVQQPGCGAPMPVTDAAPVADRVTTTKPVVAHETGNTSDKLANLKTAADKLAGYAGHDDDCQIMKHGVWSDPIPCTCGYTDAWWAYEAAKQL